MTFTKIITSCLAVLSVLAFASVVDAHSYRHGAITVGHVWAPPQPEGTGGVPVYGVIVNRESGVVRLIGAFTPDARAVSFRERPDAGAKVLNEIVLNPGRPLALAAWGPLIWLEDVNRPLVHGDIVPLTLDFGPHGTVEIEIAIEDASSH